MNIVDGRRRRIDPDARRPAQHGHEARDERRPRVGPLLLRGQEPVVDEHSPRSWPPADRSRTRLGNQVNQLQDYGIEVGGPVIKDMLWLWGSYDRNQINLITAGGVWPDNTIAEGLTAPS